MAVGRRGLAVAANQVKPVASVSQEKILRPLPFVAAAEFKQANSASALTIEHAMRRSIEIDALRKTALEHQQVRSRCCRTLPVGCQRRSYRWLSEWSLSARRAGRCLRRSAVTVLYDGLKIRHWCRPNAITRPHPDRRGHRTRSVQTWSWTTNFTNPWRPPQLPACGWCVGSTRRRRAPAQRGRLHRRTLRRLR